LAAADLRQRGSGGGGGGQRVGSTTAAGIAAAAATTAMLPPRSAVVGTKMPAVTAMVGAQTTINSQYKAVTATATEMAMMTATTIMMRTKATAAVEAVAAAAAASAVAALRQHGSDGGLEQRVGSATLARMAVAAATPALLPPHAAMVATKTPAATAMAGSQTTINNQLETVMATATATAMMTATTRMMKTKATAAVAEGAAWQQCGDGGDGSEVTAWGRRPALRWRRQLGKSTALASVAARRRQWQRQRSSGSVAEAAAVAVAWRGRPAWRRRRQLGRSATLAAAAAHREARATFVSCDSVHMVSVQICQIFSRLSNIEFVACGVCDVPFIACNKCIVACIAYIAYIACKKETLCLRLSEFLKTHRKRKRD
jgi:hypothetical protein